jgi:uncharacterized metal-binding protein YceD (DUF177 family)
MSATSEFSKHVAATDVPPNGTVIRFEADEGERAALAARFGIVELQSFKGSIGVKPWRRHGLVLEGTFEAALVQTCIVTLEPLDEKVSEHFRLYFLPLEMIERDAAAAAEREIIVDVDSDDVPDPIENGRIDVGEVMSEQLALAINPYPKKPGAEAVEHTDAPAEAAEERPNPFAILEKLKKKD